MDDSKVLIVDDFTDGKELITNTQTEAPIMLSDIKTKVLDALAWCESDCQHCYGKGIVKSFSKSIKGKDKDGKEYTKGIPSKKDDLPYISSCPNLNKKVFKLIHTYGVDPSSIEAREDVSGCFCIVKKTMEPKKENEVVIEATESLSPVTEIKA
jgi:hypothetical protein